MRDPTEVTEAGWCIGCGFCALTHDSAFELEGGFLAPHPRKAETAEPSLFRKTCPGIGVDGSDLPSDRGLWGQVNGAWLGWATSEFTRNKGASGGALSALAIHLLDSGHADAVLHVRPGQNGRYYSAVSTTAEEILAGSGSAYAPTATLAELPRALREFQKVFVVSKPCEAAAVRAAMNHDKELSTKIVGLASFFCGGLPSFYGTLDLTGWPENTLRTVRYRGNGWPGEFHATDKKGNQVSASYDESWGTFLNKTLHPRCKVCTDSVGEFADLVVADAWHLDGDGNPQFKEMPGRNLILTRTAVGRQFLSSFRASGTVHLEPLSNWEDYLRRAQPHQFNRRGTIGSRVLATKILLRTKPHAKSMRLFRRSWAAGPAQLARAFIGTIRRIARGRL